MADPFGERRLCPVCRESAQVRYTEAVNQYLCPRCDRFDVSGSAEAMLEANALRGRARVNASSWIREQRRPTIGSTDLSFLSSIRTPGVVERARKTLAYIAALRPGIGQTFDINLQLQESNLGALAATWSEDNGELAYLIRDVLAKKEWIYITSVIGSGLGKLSGIKILPEGHGELERMRHTHGTGSWGFCAMWFDPSINVVWSSAISPAIEDAGYDPKRIDSVEHNNKIDDEIVATIRQSRFVVADFTGSRGGVYFEAGFAMGLSIPVIWTVRKDELSNVHFDNRQYNFIDWTPDDLTTLRKRLRNRIEATIGKGPIWKK